MSEEKSAKKLKSAAINALLFLIVAVIAFRNNPVWVYGRPSGVAVLVALLGLLCILVSFRKTTWGRWTGAIVTLAVAGTLLGLELSLLNIGLAVVCLISLVRYIPDRDDDKPMRSLVLLLKEPHYAEGSMMARVACLGLRSHLRKQRRRD